MSETAERTGGPGIEFTETMRGYMSTSETADYEAAFEAGRAAESPLEFTVTVAVADLDRMIEDPSHGALLSGSVTAPALSPDPMTVEDGEFQLLVRDPDRPRTRKMIYRMPLVDGDGRRLHLDGFKAIHDDRGPDIWADTTTLYVTVREEDGDGPVVGKGIVNIHLNDFRRQLGTMKVTGAGGKLEELRTMARFGRFFAGALNDVYGGVFAGAFASAPDAEARERRPLRCGDPEIHAFETADGVELKLTRFEGGTKGPVILSPGLGTSAQAFTIDTTETNLPEFLWEHGYDVWVLDYRASPDLPSSATQFSMDDIARYDYPAAVAKVREATGADSVQIVAHCVGSATLLMALAAGLEGVRSVVASQLTLHPRVGSLNQVRAGTYLPNFLTALGVDTLSTDIDEDAGWADRLYDSVLRLYPAGEERCSSPVCRRILFMYGEVFDHDQLNEATHEALHEVFGVANLTVFKQIAVALREGHFMTADGEDAYLPESGRLALPIAFLHGEDNRLFLPEGSARTFEHLQEVNDPELYTRHVIPRYAHMDCFIGKDAAGDVYPTVLDELERHNPA